MKKIYLTILLVLVLFYSSLVAQVVFTSDFESWTENIPNSWNGSQTTIETDSIVPYTSSVHGGTKACRLINRETTMKTFSTIPIYLERGATYNISWWMRGKANCRLIMYTGTNATLAVWSNNSYEWAFHNVKYTATENQSAEIVFTATATKLTHDDLQIDDVTITFDHENKNLDINDISVTFGYKGAIGSFFVPKASGKKSMYESNLWVAGFDISNQLHVAARCYSNYEENDFFYGPIANDYSNQEYIQKYKRVWKINKTEIENHRTNYSAPDYVIPYSILDWPGTGNTNNGEKIKLAPFQDVNSNGIYDPANGDYPVIRGDQAVFFMLNDTKTSHASLGTKMGIEVHAMAYAFDAPADSALNQTVFLKYDIFNLSDTNYNNVRLGLFSDMDLGSYDDDFIGFDSVLNMFYTYNDAMDGDGLTYTYGNHPPAQGAMVLNKQVEKFISTNSNSGFNGDPTTAFQYNNYLNGIWLDGSILTYGGNGYGGTTPANYMFSGVPEDTTGWLDDYGADKRGLMATGPMDLNAGDAITLDLAFPFARDYTGTHLTSVALLRQRAQSIRNFYSQMLNAINQPALLPNTINIFPNPGNGRFQISIEDNSSNLEMDIFTVLGQKVFSKKSLSNNDLIDLGNSKGIFIYTIKDDYEIIHKGKLIIK